MNQGPGRRSGGGPCSAAAQRRPRAGGASPPPGPRPPPPRVGERGTPGIEDLALPRARGLRVEPPELLGDLVGIERRAGRDRAGDGDRGDVDAGGLVGARQQLGERADAGLAQRQARHVGYRLGHAAGEQDRAAAGLGHGRAEMRDRRDRAHDVDRPRVEVLASRQLAERRPTGSAPRCRRGPRERRSGRPPASSAARSAASSVTSTVIPSVSAAASSRARQRGVDGEPRAGEDGDGQPLAGEAPSDGGPDPGSRADDDCSGHCAYGS